MSDVHQDIPHKLTSIALVFLLVFGLFFPFQRKAEAIPAAIPAGAALAALAADLGISESALVTAIIAVGAGATGLAAYGAAGTDTSLPPAPGFRPWDDLTPEEKQTWGDYDPSSGSGGTPDIYAKNAIAWWALQYGLLESDGNGGYQPTEEPDPDQEPDENKRWNKARNVIMALTFSGGAVAFNEVVGPLIENGARSLKSFLFGAGQSNTPGSLGILYNATYSCDGVRVPLVALPDIYVTPSISGAVPFLNPGGNVFYYGEDTRNGGYLTIRYLPKSSDAVNLTLNRVDSVSGNYWSIDGTGHSTVYYATCTASRGYFRGDNITSVQGTTQVTSQYSGYLNLTYKGRYIFPNGEYIDNGEVSSGIQVDNVDYGQMSDTPPELTSSIYNDNNYNNFVNNYTTPETGKTRVVQIPDGIGDPSFNPGYYDFVKIKDSNKVDPIPDDKPYEPPSTDPDPDPGTGGLTDEEFTEGYIEEVGRLLAQPFDQLFPFCLIGDLRRVVDLYTDAGRRGNEGLQTQDASFVNGTDRFTIPLGGFNLAGMDDLEFTIDFTTVTDLARPVRPFLTGAFTIYLIIGSFSYFLRRGGE